MNDEIKKILDYFEEYVKTIDMHDSEPMVNWKDLKIVLDYINELQQVCDDNVHEYEKLLKMYNDNVRNYEKLLEKYFNTQYRIDKAIDYIEKEYKDNIIITDYADNPVTPQELYGELLDILNMKGRKIINKMIDKVDNEDFEICCKCEKGETSAVIRGDNFQVILGLIALEKIILSKINIDKETYEFLREHIDYEVIK